VNAAAGKGFVKVHEDTLRLVSDSKRYAELTGGAFDPTVRPLVSAWNIGGKSQAIPESREIRRALRLISYRDILVDWDGGSIMLRRRNMALDLGGVAKGLAADEARRILLENGISDAVINLGGSVIVIGAPITVGIQHPDRRTGIPAGYLLLNNQAAVTSGIYEKSFVKNGRCYHHLLDPQTGYPADSGLKSVTLIGDRALELDALSTAIFILGAEKGSRIAEKFELQAIFITTENEVFVTAGLKDAFSLLGQCEVNYG
jgi:thiamine biosynthesis lipoprotein